MTIFSEKLLINLRTRVPTVLGILGWLTCLLILIPGTALSATYYTAKSGSNSNSCADAQIESKPKLTIAAGMSCLSSGDTLVVKAGTYDEGLDSAPSGTSWTNVTTIRANPGDTVILSKSGSATNRIATFKNKSYIEIDGFICNSSIGQLWNVFKFDGTTHHIRLQNLDISGARYSGIQDSSEEGVGGHEILNNSVHDNGTDGLDHGIYLVSNNGKIWNNDFYNNSGYGIQLWIATYDVDDNDIQFNRVWNNGAIGNKGGMTINGSRNLVANNIVWNNANGGIFAFGGSDSKYYNNTSYNNSGGEGGIRVNPAARNTRLTNNISYNNGGPAISDAGSGTVRTSNLTSNPLFVNAAANDFHLQSGSSARDSGVSLAEVTADFDRVSRPQGAGVDIGAFEYTISSPPQPVATVPMPPTLVQAE